MSCIDVRLLSILITRPPPSEMATCKLQDDRKRWHCKFPLRQGYLLLHPTTFTTTLNARVCFRHFHSPLLKWIHCQSLYIKCTLKIASSALTSLNLRFKLYPWHWRRYYFCTLLPSLSLRLPFFASPNGSQVPSAKCQAPAEKVWHFFKNPSSILNRPTPQF